MKPNEKKPAVDPRIIEKNQQEAKNMIKGMGNVAQQEQIKARKALKKLSEEGKVNAIHDKFNAVISKYPAFGKYSFCKGCDTSTPHIKGECVICGQ